MAKITKRNSITEEDKLNYRNKFEKLLCRFIDDNDFLSHKRVKYFDDELWEYLSLLKRLIENGNEEFAIELGQMIKARLKSIDTDDDTFPEYEIYMIDDIIRLK